MLIELKIENFKSWKKADIKLAPLTVFFGANSSGKSSLTQFLLLLKQTKESTDRSIALDFGSEQTYVNLGSFKDVIHNHNESNSLKWNLIWNQSKDLKIVNPESKRSEFLFHGKELSISSEVKIKGQKIFSDFLEYNFSNERFTLSKGREGRNSFKLDAKKYKFKRTHGRVWDIPAPIKSYAFPDQVRTYFQNASFLSDLEKSYEEQLDRIFHLGPLRDYPKRQYTWAGSSPSDVGRRGERVVEAILAATARKDERNLRPRSPVKPFQEMVAFWLEEMGLIDSFSVKAIGDDESGLYRVHVKRDKDSADTLITDVGFGVSQILPVLVLLYYAPEESTIIFEQPEIHLHPAVQASLADLIITTVKHRKLQVIVESHSEHFLQRLTRRVAEGKSSPYMDISPEDIKLYFCSMSGGKSDLEALNLDMFGTISNWPKDFFGDAFGDIMGREKAALKNRIRKK